MNIERSVSEKQSDIISLLISVGSEYTNGLVNQMSIPGDYKILFVLCRSVNVSNQTYTIDSGSDAERIFYEAVENFKRSVEKFANGNVHIIPTVKEISQTIIGSTTIYLQYEDIENYIKEFSCAGMFDAVISASLGSWSYDGGTRSDRFMFCNTSGNGYNFYGYSGCTIALSNDQGRIYHGYDETYDYPYLLTTNRFIHEWLHQLEGFRDYFKVDGQSIIYPYTHAYYEDFDDNPTQPWMYKNNYSWNTSFFSNSSLYPNIMEPDITSFYRAVLACAVTYSPNNKLVGMYPGFWKITPHKMVLGKYIIKNAQGKYLYYNSQTESMYQSDNLSNETKYLWDIYSDFEAPDTTLYMKSCSKRDYEISMNNSNYFQVGPYDEGAYLVVNITNNMVLGFTVSGASIYATLENYRTTEFETYTLSFNSDCYYRVSPVCTLQKYLHLSNALDSEDNTVSFYALNVFHPESQTWQFRNTMYGYDVMPLASPTRSLSYHDSALHIVSSSNIQKWRLEKLDNGKYIFNGVYKIQDVQTGKYLYSNGTTLKLSAVPIQWNIQGVGNNYYTISASIANVTKYFDVLNNYDLEGNTIQVHTGTGVADAQNWKFMLLPDGNVYIVPKRSLSRGLASTTSGSALTTNCSAFKLILVPPN